MFDLDFLAHTTPAQVDVSLPEITTDDRRLLRFAEKCVEEAQSWREDLGLERRLDRAFEFMAGNHFVPAVGKKHRTRIVANFLRSVVERKAGMLTDTIPQLEVISRSNQKLAAGMLKDAARGVWEERSAQQVLTRAIVSAAMAGHAPWIVTWDRGLDFGRGDIRLDVLQGSQVLIDPFLTRASALQEDAQYVIIKVVRPLAEFRELYKRGSLVKAEPGLSQYTKSKEKLRSNSTMSGVWHKPSRQNQNFENAAIPRAIEYRLYFRDRTVDPQNPRNKDGTLNYLFPRKRLIIWSGNTPLYDGPSAYWDGHFPVELFDWGIETRHPYGESEVENLLTLQMGINIILSGIVDNARLINDPPWLVDDDALYPEDLANLRKYGDRPGWVTEKRPNLQVKRDPPGQMSPIVFNTLGMLRDTIESVSGVSAALQGQLPPGVNSGVLLDSIQLSAQVPIRMQGRTIEDFLGRIGQLMLSRIIQYYSDERLMYATDDQMAAQTVIFNRKSFLDAIGYGKVTKQKRERMLQNVFRDFRFHVIPGSALAVAKLQKLAVMERLNAAGKVPDVEVLKAAEISEPEQSLQDSRQEMMLKMQMMQGPPPAAPQGQGGIMNKPNLTQKPVQQAAPGANRGPSQGG